ncbi:alpha-ketoglutarate-dependent dioxygenase AlkB family protein [Niabella beijingensis]|uniref:alpha-ketoglutarate-dependent dioxygenase AlkB family protein n=1 Tax=Niabella beijingensis TaxID=2872700 RepID=UPI001CBEB91E|nr:alpha-ketoglutarate-dependent dioxygenase AlkB [Niabella beijingensis]MBZ4192664.1 alpha-ketoglutarate-dependent dioxygenase AlkB [Niabella beijingensis]
MQQQLFDQNEQLLLPGDLMEYTSEFLSPEEGNYLLPLLINTVPWQQARVMMYDKEVLTPRLSAWYGDRRTRDENKREALRWTDELQSIRERLQLYTGHWFNGVLLNYYRDENDSVAWHSDKDSLTGLKTEIASVSIGQVRHFEFRNKQDHRQRHSLQLEHGALLLMKPGLQERWEHRIAKSVLPMTPRINLTFRKVLE